MIANNEPSTVLFEEEQTFRQPWLWAVMGFSALAGCGAILAAALAAPAQSGSILPVGGIVIGTLILATALLWLMKLRVRVMAEGLHVRFRPFVDRLIPFSQIEQVEVRTYRPIVEYGGWGIRYSLIGRGVAYNVSGNRGVQLVLADGKRVLIGSQLPEELAEAIRRGKG